MMREGSHKRTHTLSHTHTALVGVLNAALTDIIVMQKDATAPPTVRRKNSENLTCLSFA